MSQLNAERQPVRLSDLPWESYEFGGDPAEAEALRGGATFKSLIPLTPQTTFVYVRFAPNFVAPEHWHPSPTIYLIAEGEFHVGGEGIYRKGDFRWVAGEFAYGPEAAGPDGCEFYLGSLGPFATYDPKEVPAPRGSWRDTDSSQSR